MAEERNLQRLLQEAEEKIDEQERFIAALVAERDRLVEEREGHLRRMSASSFSDAEEKYDERGRTIQRQDGKSFCTVHELFEGGWEAYTEDHFTSLCRSWDDIVAHRGEVGEDQNDDFKNMFLVYDTTRTAATADGNVAAISPSVMSVGKLMPVRLCSHEQDHKNAEKAHLCPKTGAFGKADTWIYVAAAVLGMPAKTLEDRKRLLKAVRGSAHKGKSAVIDRTGLNRSPFNLISFLSQGNFFDEHPGVLVLPCLDPQAARNWRGESYSIIILCRDVRGVSTADNIARKIGLVETPPENLHKASDSDIECARQLLCQVLLSAAYCLVKKDGPPTKKGKQLWDKYRLELQGLQQGVYMMLRDKRVFESVMIPMRLDIPEEKFVAKINLCEMTPPDSEATSDAEATLDSKAIPAYPDPLLLAFKSSVNWTRAGRFQMIAEAEPPEDDVDAYPPFLGLVAVDKGSAATPNDDYSQSF